MLPEENSGRVVVVGPPEIVAPFRAAGIDACPVEPGPTCSAQVETLVQRGYRIVFFTADLAPHLDRLLERYSRSATPCLVPLLLGDAGTGAGRLRALVRRAVGADVLKAPGKEKGS
ncbi:MAG: V-type ATP synthase subunit F [candidate division WOR-3 bacterium]